VRPKAKKATHQQTKTHNSRLVLGTIYDQGKISRAGIARVTHLTRATVSDAVADLIRRGLVTEVGRGPSAGGKSPILLSVDRDAQHLIGVDLAAGEFRGAVVDFRGEIRHAISLPLGNRTGQAALALAFQLVDALTAATQRPIAGIGIGTPGLFDTVNGVVRRAVNVGWENLPLGDLLQARYHLPVCVINDCQATALAEYMFGAGQDAGNLVVLRVGHGIGAGVVLDGQLFQGDGFGAGEVGHVVVVEDGLPCRCGNFGCLETVASSAAIVQRAELLARAAPDSRLHRQAVDGVPLGLTDVVDAFRAGDDPARQVVAETGRYLGMAAANLVATLNIHRILVAGSVTQFGHTLVEAIQREMLSRALPILARDTQLGLASLGPDGVILGTSALLLTREFGLRLNG
jgi:glucokinase-like ROK family protein